MNLHRVHSTIAAAATTALFLILTPPAAAQLLPEVLAAPQIISIEGHSVSPIMKWSSITGAVKYEFEISMDPSFSSAVLVDTSTSDTIFSAPVLPQDTGFYCRVRALPVSPISGWSTVSRFYSESLKDVFTLHLDQGWNFISFPLDVTAGVRNFLFPIPCAKTIFCYGGAFICCGLYNPLWERWGFWIKLANDVTIGVTGTPLASDTQTVVAGWNLVGSLFRPFLVSSVTTDPPGVIISRFFTSQNNRYIIADTIKPFKAYWVKATESGSVFYALPPTPPGHVRAYVHWQNSGIPGIRLALLNTKDTLITDSTGHAEFTVPSNHYTLRAFDINQGGPAFLFIDFDAVVFPGETTDIDIPDCLPCL